MKKSLLIFTIGLVVLMLNLVGFATTADAVEVADFTIALNTMWVLIAAILVFFMQAGFAMVEAGFTRAKNAGNIIMKNFMDFSVGSFVFFAVGFGLMFGDSVNGLIGWSGFLNPDKMNLDLDGLPVSVFIIFQTVFAATAATIVSGAMAERTKFKAYLAYSALITLFIYPVVGHWTWGGGWLGGLGFHDFAGSTIVHSVGGWAALMGAMVIGPRIGKYGKDGRVNSIPGHSLTLGALGVFILWFGWFGFNPGSTLAATPDIARIAMTTNLSAACAAIVAMIFTWIRQGKPNVSYTLNGALGGLVAITAGTDVVSMWGAITIGSIAGFVIVLGVDFIDRVLKIDDPVGAVAVHGLCGAFGTIAVGLFAVEGGLFYGGGVRLLGIQALGVVAVAAWVLTTSFILFKTISATLGLRVTKEDEEVGLDRGEHATSAYSDFLLQQENVDTEDLKLPELELEHV